MPGAPMSTAPTDALSPLDGRYAGKLAEVARIFPASPRVVPTGVTGAPVLRGAMLAAIDQARSDLLDSV